MDGNPSRPTGQHCLSYFSLPSGSDQGFPLPQWRPTPNFQPVLSLPSSRPAPRPNPNLPPRGAALTANWSFKAEANGFPRSGIRFRTQPNPSMGNGRNSRLHTPSESSKKQPLRCVLLGFPFRASPIAAPALPTAFVAALVSAVAFSLTHARYRDLRSSTPMLAKKGPAIEASPCRTSAFA